MTESVYPADALRFSFPEELPISARADEILEKLKTFRVVIVCGATGSGKTTQLPKIALRAGCGRHGKIGCTQPRRIAASSLAKRVAAELGASGGSLVGYKVRFDDSTTKDTIVKFMTDGILLAETRADPLLRRYDCIILDEVHERSLNIDFLLGSLKLILPKRPDLKLIVSSATLEAERMSAFFGGAPVVEVEGRTYPVEDVWLPPAEDAETAEAVAEGVDFVTGLDPRGDILVFLPGEREIRECADMLRGRGIHPDSILPLFGRLSGGEQQRVFTPSKGGLRRIVLATNVAETSLTIPGIRFVVDTGLVRLSRYNPRSRIQELRIETVSQASARQRRGRCGRTRDGVCVHLYSEDAFRESAEFTPPEIQRSSLAGVILQMASLNLPPLGEFPLVDEPAPALVREGFRALSDIGAIEGPERRVTKTGRLLAAMPVDPHIGKMLLEAEKRKVLPEMLAIASFLSIQDPAERPFERAAEADGAHRKLASDRSDFLGILNLWNAVRKARSENNSQQGVRRFAKANFYSFRRLREWENLLDDLNEGLPAPVRKRAAELVIDLERVPSDALHMAVLSGIPRNLALYDPETKLYSDMAGKKSVLFPGSGLARRKNPPRWIMSFVLMETSRVFSRCAAEARPEWLEEVAPRLCAYVYESPEWDPRSGFVYALERVRAGNLPIHPGRRKHYGTVAPVEARKIFIQQGLATGLAEAKGTWLDGYSKDIRSLREFETRLRRPDSLVRDDFLADWFDETLPPDVNSTRDVLRDWNANHISRAPSREIILENADPFDPADYPDFLVSSGEKFRLLYRFEPGEGRDGLTLLAPEDKLNLLDRWIPDYLVPGLLGQKIELLLKSLPKALRIQLMPVRETAERFTRACRDGSVFTGQPLSDALSEWIADQYDFRPPPFDPEFLPEYLVMKLALVNSRGAVSRVVREYPADSNISSVLSTGIASAREWSRSAGPGWPGDMPESVTLSGKSGTTAYPALTAEESGAGMRVFLKESEALESQRNGLVRLFALRHAGLFKQLRNGANLPGNVRMNLFLKDPSWREDAAANAVLAGFGCEPRSIRTLQDFESALERAREESYAELEKLLRSILAMHAGYEDVVSPFRKLRENSLSRMEIRAHLDLLFRPGFLRLGEALPFYPRYLKALGMRALRAVNSPASDEKKGLDLAPWIGKQKLALNLAPEIRTAPGLLDYFLLVEEARINRYAPEIPTRMKTGESALRNAWDSVRLS